MAAAANEPQSVILTINDIEIEVPKGELIVESVKRIGLEIPIFCYHSRMKPVGMCRMCLVDVGFKQPDGSVRMMPKPQAGCTLPADNNMVVYTDTEKVRRDRKGVLEFLLINHPLDCPICDRGGECPLQNNTIFYGPSTTRYVEIKRHLPKAFPLSKYVTLDLERCIQCGRCVRFTEEISGDSQLAFRFRGAMMQPSTFELTEFESRFSGNVIEICPVGALTSAEYRFRARPWDLQTKPSICLECSNGCNTWFDYRVASLVRINGRTNEAVNEEWTCDKGKFGQNYLNSPDRLTEVFVRDGDKLIESNWATAFQQVSVAFQSAGSKCAALVGGKASNEDIFMLKRLFTEAFGSNNLDHRWTRCLPKSDALYRVATSIADFENEPVIFVFGNNIAEEQPILFLRIRKAWFRNDAKVIVACPEACEADTFAHTSLRYRPGTEAVLLGAIHRAATGAGGVDIAEASSITGVGEEAIRRAADAMKSGFALAASRSLLDLRNGEHVVGALSNLAIACNSSEKYNLFATSANEEGARQIEFMPSAEGKNTREILEACASGEMKALWLLECDPLSLCHDKELVTKALETVEFLVVQNHIKSECVQFASVLLPACAFSEKDGTYTNLERRVQRIKPIIAAKGSAKPAWKSFGELLLRMKGDPPPFHAHEVMQLIAASHQKFQSAIYENLEGEGVVIPANQSTEPQAVDVEYTAMEVPSNTP